jgi:ankyrin repeat protein
MQLFSHVIGINTVLHSTARPESATILATAAYEGQVDIMLYLINCSALINYQDPLLRRTALHWACMGGRLESVQLLLTYGCSDVNCLDRDNVTPIIQAAIQGMCVIYLKLNNCIGGRLYSIKFGLGVLSSGQNFPPKRSKTDRKFNFEKGR